MSFPYTLDLSFCSEQSSVDSVGRISFGTSGGGGGDDQSKSKSFPLASRGYNFQAPSTAIFNQDCTIWAHLENVTLDENAPQIVKDWWATKPTLKYEPWPVTELPSQMRLYYEYRDSSDQLEMGFLFNTHPNDSVYKFGYWSEEEGEPIIILTGDLVLDDPETWSIENIDPDYFPAYLYK